MAIKYGTNGDDSITGTKADDALYGRGGDDVLKGYANDDRLFGQAGNDLFYGGYGDDTLIGGAGVDKLDYSGITATSSTTGYGINANLVDGIVYTSVAGIDTVYNIENIDGTEVGDYIVGNGEDNVLAGKGGDDLIHGREGNDRLYGGDGYDEIYGGFGNDRLSGGRGDDVLYGREGDDVLFGGSGRDIFFDTSWDGSDDTGRDLIEDFVRGQDRIYFEVYSDSLVLRGFSDLDSNDNGVIDNSDDRVRMGLITHNGVTESSTIIDTTGFEGPDSLVVFGTTGLTSAVFYR